MTPSCTWIESWSMKPTKIWRLEAIYMHSSNLSCGRTRSTICVPRLMCSHLMLGLLGSISDLDSRLLRKLMNMNLGMLSTTLSNELLVRKARSNLLWSRTIKTNKWSTLSKRSSKKTILSARFVVRSSVQWPNGRNTWRVRSIRNWV